MKTQMEADAACLRRQMAELTSAHESRGAEAADKAEAYAKELELARATIA